MASMCEELILIRSGTMFTYMPTAFSIPLMSAFLPDTTFPNTINVNTKISEMKLVTADETYQILNVFNATNIEIKEINSANFLDRNKRY